LQETAARVPALETDFTCGDHDRWNALKVRVPEDNACVVGTNRSQSGKVADVCVHRSPRDTKLMCRGRDRQIWSFMSSDEMKTILEKLGHIETGIRNMGTRLEAVENKVEALETIVVTRLQETTPLWVSDLGEEMQQGFRFLNKKVDLVHDDFLNLRTDELLLEKEVEDLRKKVS
jgi:hypothetical protein